MSEGSDPVPLAQTDLGGAQSKAEQKLASLSWILQVASDLAQIFARDDSEEADRSCISSLGRAFGADFALFYSVDAQGEPNRYRAGDEVSRPLSAPEREEIQALNHAVTSTYHFGLARLPGLGEGPTDCLALRISSSESNDSCLLLGKRGGSWSDEDGLSFLTLSGMFGPILKSRREGRIEAKQRQLIELQLAESEKRLQSFF